MQSFFLGISLTLNLVFIIGIIVYFKVKTFGIKKVQAELAKKFYYSDDEIDEKLKEW